MTEQWIGDVIEGAYDAAIDGRWYEWLEFLRSSMGASGGLLAPLGHANALPIACGSDIDVTTVDSYLSQRLQDPWYCQAHNQPNQVICVDSLTRKRRARSAIAGLCSKLDSHFHTGSVLSCDGGEILLTLHRSAEQQDFNPQQLAALTQIIGHLRSALALTPLLFERVEHRLQQAKLDDCQRPQAVIRDNGVPAYVNDAMSQFLHQQDQPLHYHQGRLAVAQPLMSKRLQQAQRAACGLDGQSAHLHLGDNQLQIQPLPSGVLENASLWQISPAR